MEVVWQNNDRVDGEWMRQPYIAESDAQGVNAVNQRL